MKHSTIDILQEEYENRKEAFPSLYKSDYKLTYGKVPICFLVTIDRITDRFQEYYGVGENRTLTTEEIKCIYTLCNTIIKFKNKSYRDMATITLGTGRSDCCSSIFKTPDNVWITWDTDERNGASLKGIYNNCYDACIELINNLPEEVVETKETKIEAIAYFENTVCLEIDYNTLLDFSKRKHYIINDDALTKDPQLIKKKSLI